MEVSKAIRERRSIRRFRPVPVKEADMRTVMGAAAWAPSACNKQMWEFVTVRSEKIKERLVDEAGAVHFMKDSPVVVYVLYRSDVTVHKSANVQSAAAAVQNMLLTAHSIGLGGVWICSCGDDDKVRRILSVPENLEVVCAVALGYPDESPKAPKRRGTSMFHQERYSGTGTAPLSTFPKDWDEKELEAYRTRGIRATSPSRKAHAPPFEDEFRNEIRLAGGFIRGKKVLDVLGFSGAYTLELLDYAKDLHTYDTSEDVLNFIKARKEAVGARGRIGMQKGGIYRIPYGDGSFDAVTCFKKLEMLPEPARLVGEMRRVLRKNGTLVLSFWKTRNAPSVNHYLRTRMLGRKYVTSNEGPVSPLSARKVIGILRESGFVIEEEYGLNVLPKRSVGRYLNLEKGVHKGIGKSFSRTILLRCRKNG